MDEVNYVINLVYQWWKDPGEFSRITALSRPGMCDADISAHGTKRLTCPTTISLALTEFNHNFEGCKKNTRSTPIPRPVNRRPSRHAVNKLRTLINSSCMPTELQHWYGHEKQFHQSAINGAISADLSYKQGTALANERLILASRDDDVQTKAVSPPNDVIHQHG